MPHIATDERCHVCVQKIEDGDQRIGMPQPGVTECGRCDGAVCEDHRFSCSSCDADFCVDCLAHHEVECK